MNKIEAWMTEDGARVVTDATKSGMIKDGGASASSMRPYDVPLTRAGTPDAAAAAIAFALDDDDGGDFLTYWHDGRFDVCRRNWPNAPEECYIGADPLLPETKDMLDKAVRTELLHALSFLPRVMGVARDGDSPGGKGVLLAFQRPLTDQELRNLHELLSLAINFDAGAA